MVPTGRAQLGAALSAVAQRPLVRAPGKARYLCWVPRGPRTWTCRALQGRGRELPAFTHHPPWPVRYLIFKYQLGWTGWRGRTGGKRVFFFLERSPTPLISKSLWGQD